MKTFLFRVTFFSLLCAGLSLARIHAQEATDDADPSSPTVETASKPPPWTGRFDFGYTWQSGRSDKNELSLRAQADRKVDDHELRALAEYLYGEVEGERNTDRLTGSFRWRRDMTERLFTQTLTLYEKDRIREINHRVEQNLGLGYRYLVGEKLNGSIVPGLTIQYTNYTDSAGQDDEWDYLASLSQDLNWQFNDAYRFEEEINFLIDPADTDNYTVRFNLGVVGTLTDSINLSIRYQLIYENEVAPDVERTDQRVIAAVGYAF